MGIKSCKRLHCITKTVPFHSATLISIRDQRCIFLAKTPYLQAFSALIHLDTDNNPVTVCETALSRMAVSKWKAFEVVN